MTDQLADGPDVATALETQLYFLDRKAGRRGFLPLRRDFVQWPPRAKERPSVLASFVRGRDVRALRSYLFILAVTSSDLDGWSTTLNSSVWARALNTTDSADATSARAAVIKILDRLQRRGLVTYERVAGSSHSVRVSLLREDGSGEAYTRPGYENRDPYLKLPLDIWAGGQIHDLGLPALAMLLVLSCERPGFELPAERTPEWYGWSADTAERGFKELAKKGLLEVKKTYKKAPASPKGYTHCNQYTLVAPYRHRTPSPGGTPTEGQI
ncbi:hypothetical protein [Streptomyces sp. NBC_01565]|uniref:hypothetical protein n=1 Tax=Streptomyces sp. NBC_01565 TaxID=2975881 RepID=UPI002254D144|nr:hypothetical protein [Streptomyces sp. NBC_01565]MCX4540828.1 hypothetical protein [Streptomyces sp. NBC_01565]